MSLPPKPPSRPEKVSLWRYMKLFRRDILSAQPEKLYRAWMAEFKTPFFRSYLANDPELIRCILKERPQDFPKSDRVGEGLRPLLGRSVFLTNGDVWERQRRIIDPAFEGGRLRNSFDAIEAASKDAADRLFAHAGGIVDIESHASHAAADVIFRTLFSIPIKNETAYETYTAFRTYQRSQPILNIAAFVPLPRWMPRGFGRKTLDSAAQIRGLIEDLTAQRHRLIADGTAPDDLATKIMTTPDPETGELFELEEMVDQVAIFFLAGHETSASALSWALYLLALYPEWQETLAQEADALQEGVFSEMSKLRATRDVFRETLRLYPPVPMMVRETTKPEIFRKRAIKKGAQLVISPWHLHRHTRLWDNPDGFDPTRWHSPNGQTCAKTAFIPFSAGARVCPGAGFAMLEGVMMLAHILKRVRLELVPETVPVPVAHLTVRAHNGIRLAVVRR